MIDRYSALIKLLDEAIREAEALKDRAKSDPGFQEFDPDIQMTLKNLERLRSAAMVRELPFRSGGANFGLSQGIGEWLQEGRLRDLAGKIDDFFSREFK